MRSSTVPLAVPILLLALFACGQGDVEQSEPTVRPADAEAQQEEVAQSVAPEIPGVVAGGTVVRFLGDEFEGTEGPIALPDGSLIFTETNASRITRIDQDDNITTFMENTNGSNALGFDGDGRLISVQTTPGQTRVGVIRPPEAEQVLADSYEGRPFGRPNDIVVSSTLGIYFTEPGTGGEGDADPAIYHIAPNGSLTVAYHADDIGFPNGIQLNPDESVLYVNDARGEYLVAFDVQPDGTLTNRRNFARYEEIAPDEEGAYNTRADGLAVDNEGRVYSAIPPGVQVFSPDGQHLGTIPVPLRVQNLAFAGPDKRTLYMVGSGAAYKVQMLAQGFTGRAK